MLLAATMGLRWVGPDIWDFMKEGLHQSFANQTGEDLTPGRVAEMGRNAGAGMALALAPFFAILAVAAIVFNMGQTGPMLTGQKIKPKMSHISPLSGFKRIYSMEGLVNLGRTVFKMGVVSLVVAFTLYQRMEEITFLGQYPVSHSVGVIAGICFDIALRSAAILFVLTIADYFWQRYQFFKRQKMTKDEVRREHKDSDGDPQIKAALRRKRQSMLNRMIASVPDADVVVTNPTHYAVALKYDPGSMAAPTVVARGERLRRPAHQAKSRAARASRCSKSPRLRAPSLPPSKWARPSPPTSTRPSPRSSRGSTPSVNRPARTPNHPSELHRHERPGHRRHTPARLDARLQAAGHPARLWHDQPSSA
ncbi:MAG: EscU/YscU/HrcU family type III secretion system export apparatus switch protein [Dehalococcoidia bacterium]|nr:EscU/YscU/HrcU family type III secretion system export apparatus switch protein [Dehalococcoidia bacterium]